MLDAVRQYLHDTLGVVPRIHDWDGARQLPYALRDNFDLYAMQVLGREVVLAVRSAARKRLPPVDVAKQLGRVAAAADRPVPGGGLRRRAGSLAVPDEERSGITVGAARAL